MGNDRFYSEEDMQMKIYFIV